MSFPPFLVLVSLPGRWLGGWGGGRGFGDPFELAQQERVIRAEVSGAWEAVRLLTDRATTLTAGPISYLARADEARSISFGAYREGALPLTQVMDAARAWSESRISFFGVLFAQHEAVLALLAAQGSDITGSLETIR